MDLIKVKIGLKEFMEGNEIVIRMKKEDFKKSLNDIDSPMLNLPDLKKIVVASKVVSPKGEVMVNYSPVDVDGFSLAVENIQYWYTLPNKTEEYDKLLQEFTDLKLGNTSPIIH